MLTEGSLCPALDVLRGVAFVINSQIYILRMFNFIIKS